MRVYTIRAGSLAKAAVACCLLVAIVFGLTGLLGEPESIAVFGRNKAEVKCADEQARLDYLTDFGWTVEGEPQKVEVIIPSEFEGVYAEYEQIQKDQGFRLAKYKGKTVTQYTYTVTNHPEGGAKAELLVYQDKIIAASISSDQLGGFMRALDEKPAESSAPESKP